MLVIFDKKTRTQGVKEYLEQGTKHDRDEKDKRVTLIGNLDITDKVAEIGRKKGYKEAYRNIVLSFEEKLDEKTLENIARDFINLYMQPYQDDEYCVYAEAHLPKKKVNSRGYERKNHIHIVIPKYSLKLGHQLDLGDHSRRLKEIEKIKEYLEAKYNLKSLNRKKIITQDKAEILDIEKYKNRNKAKKSIENYIAKNIAHYEKLDDLISDLEKKLDAEIKTSKNAKTPYISIKLPNFNRAIRLKGELFNSKTFKEAREQLLKNNKYIEVKKTKRKDPREILTELEELQKKRKERILKRIKNKRLQAEQEYIKQEQSKRVKNYLSYAERELNKIYNYQFNLELPKGFFVRKYNNTGYTLISNKKRNIKILDKGDKIIGTGRNLEEQAKIMIEMAIAKGWDLRKVRVEGSEEFKRIVRELIEQRLQQQSFSLALAEASVKIKETQPSSYTQSKLQEAKDQQQIKELDLKTLKEVLTAEELLNALKERGLIQKDYQIDNNKIIIGKRKLNIVDFCLKEMNLSFKETSKLLNDIYNADLKEFKGDNMQKQIDWKQIKKELHPLTIAKFYNLDIKPEQISKKNDEYRIKVSNNRKYNVIDYLLKEQGLKFKDITENIDNLMKLQQQLKLQKLNEQVKLTETAKNIKQQQEQEEYKRIINNAKQEDLSIFLAEQGFKVVKEKTSINYRVMEDDNGDRLVIYKRNGKYRYFNVHNEYDKGDIYNFFANRGIKSYKQIADIIKGANKNVKLQPLQTMSSVEINNDKVIKAVETYKRYQKQTENDYSYLIEDRKIDENIIRMYSNYIKSDRNKNIIVPLFSKVVVRLKRKDKPDEKLERIELVGYDRRLKQREENQPKSYINGRKGVAILQPFYADKETIKETIEKDKLNEFRLKKLSSIKNVVIAENYIDAMSYIQLRQLNPSETTIISTQGTITDNNVNTIKMYLKTANKYAKLENIVIAMDNDEAGRKMANKLKEELKEYQDIVREEYPNEKDWNDELKKAVEKANKELEEKIKILKNSPLYNKFLNEIDKLAPNNEEEYQKWVENAYSDEKFEEWLKENYTKEEIERLIAQEQERIKQEQEQQRNSWNLSR